MDWEVLNVIIQQLRSKLAVTSPGTFHHILLLGSDTFTATM